MSKNCGASGDYCRRAEEKQKAETKSGRRLGLAGRAEEIGANQCDLVVRLLYTTNFSWSQKF